MIDDRFFERTNLKIISDLFEIPLVVQLCSDRTDIPNFGHIESVAVLKEAGPLQLSFFDNKKYKDAFLKSDAGFCVVAPEYKAIAPKGMCVIPSHDPYRLYAVIATHLYKDLSRESSPLLDYKTDQYGGMIHKNATIEDDVKTAPGVVIEAGAVIGSGTTIKANTFIARGCQIGRHCFINSNVSISHALIGDYVVIGAGARIGEDGFGFAMGVTHYPVPQLGRAIIQDRVNIGANTCIDRGTIKDTIIGEGTCLDNMVQIGHNTVIGVHCIVAGNSAIAGSVTFGDYVICGGHACVAGHLQIDSNSRISGGSAVTRDVSTGKTVAGYPAQDIRSFFRNTVFLNKIAKRGT